MLAGSQPSTVSVYTGDSLKLSEGCVLSPVALVGRFVPVVARLNMTRKQVNVTTWFMLRAITIKVTF